VMWVDEWGWVTGGNMDTLWLSHRHRHHCICTIATLHSLSPWPVYCTKKWMQREPWSASMMHSKHLPTVCWGKETAYTNQCQLQLPIPVGSLVQGVIPVSFYPPSQPPFVRIWQGEFCDVFLQIASRPSSIFGECIYENASFWERW